jgi:hypothetical protein
MHGRQFTSIARRLVILNAFLLLAATPQLKAQTTSGTLIGLVRDKAGRGLPETKITIENEENGNRRATRTDEAGNYTIFNLPPGAYKITASKDGFREQTIKGFPIQFNQKNVIRLPLFTLLTGTLNGRVVDTAGNALPGARIIVVGKSDNVSRETVADRAGFYSFPDLPFDLYKVTTRWEGRRGELTGDSSISLTPRTESTQFVSVLFPKRRQPELDASSSRLPATSKGRPAVIQPAQFRRPAFTSIGGSISDAWLRDRQPISAPSSNRSPATPALTQPGQPAQTASEGAAAAALVNTTDAARSSNFTERQLNSLPVGGATAMRSFDEFALLAPGVAPPPYTPGVRGPGVGFGIGTAGQFSVNGMRARSNNFSVDGSDNNDPDVGVRRQGFVALVPQPIESVKEISISTLLWDAELARNFGSQVNAVTKYGANKYHGQLYALLTDSRLNARNFFDTNGKPPFTRTQLGLTVGGPIVSKRTQFFFSFERQKTNASITQHFAVPTRSQRSLLNNSEFNVLHAGNSHRGVIHSHSGTTGLGGMVLSYYPLPNGFPGPYGPNNYAEFLPADSKGLVSSLRLTRQFSGNTLNARYNLTDDNRTLPSINRALRSSMGSATRSHNLSLILDSQLTDTLFNQARFSFGRTRLNFSELPRSPLFLPRGIAGDQGEDDCIYIHPPPLLSCSVFAIASLIAGLGEVLVEPYSPVGVNAYSLPQGRVNNTFQYADSLSWQWRTHSLKFGGDVRRVQLNSFQDRLYRPQVVFGYGLATFGDVGSFNTGKNFPDFMPQGKTALLTGVQLAALGLPSSIFQSIATSPAGSRIGLRETEFHFFVNDNWRVRPNVTLDYGLRYEYGTVPREVNNRIEDAITLRNLPVPGSSIFDTSSRIDAFNAAVDAYRKVLGGRTRMYDADKNNFGPHLGFAWDPRSDGKMSIRGGYGIYYDAILGAVVSQSRNVFPNDVPVNIDPTFFGSVNLFFLNTPAFLTIVSGANEIPFVQSVFTNQISGGLQDRVALLGYLFEHNQLGAGLAFTLPAKKLATPYAQQWHLTAEREVYGDYLISAAYVGTRGVKLTRLTTPNLGLNLTPVIPIALTRFGAPIQTACPPYCINSGSPVVIADLVSGSTAAFAQRHRPIAALGAYEIFENSASSNYHALQIEARKRYSHNYQFTAAYTWSHAIDDVSDLFPIAGAPVIAQDSFNFRAERGDANFDIRHRFVASLLWDLPFYRNSSGGVGRIFRDWQIASIFQMNTGQPFTLNLPVDANLDGNLTDRASTTNGLIFLSGHGPQRVALAPGKQLTDFFSFRSNGAVGRNTARGDNFIDLDLSFSRTFKFGETKSLLFRAEFFNLFNRANFGLPVRVIGAPGFGSAVDTITPGRTIVIVMKSSF